MIQLSPACTAEAAAARRQFARRATLPTVIAWLLLLTPAVHATPANKSALERHYDRFLSKELNRCTTCHLPSDKKAPETLEEFPHNPFGDRLRRVGVELANAAPAESLKSSQIDIARRLTAVASEDSDGDGVSNETELLLGFPPGDPAKKPSALALEGGAVRRAEFAKFLEGYAWRPYTSVTRPSVPKPRQRRWVRNPIDAFIAAEHEARGLTPRIEASRQVLLRRTYLDLLGLSPTPEEQSAFLADSSAHAHEALVDRLLDDPRYGERWGRHWMDVWRYSDWAGWTDGGQVRDSKPHIWRWRDWIVESLNNDKPYDRMILEMLAADELAPEDTNALRATGFLVRNYKMLSREQWLEDTLKHTAQAFLGLTLGCAKCHDHMTEPVSQKEYYQVRAIFEPHQVRTDRLPGQTNTALDGLVRVFDAGPTPPTWFLERGDERHPRTNAPVAPGVPGFLGGSFKLEPISLPRFAASPDKRPWVIQDNLAAGERAVEDAQRALELLRANPPASPEKIREQELITAAAEARLAAFTAVVHAEELEDDQGKGSEEWRTAATAASTAERQLAVAEATLSLYSAEVAAKLAQAKATDAEAKKDATAKAAQELAAAEKKLKEADKTLLEARRVLAGPPAATYRGRSGESYPALSTGRRLAFARWLTDTANPLTARVAINHLWQRHFGRGLVSTPADFGRNGRPPSHAQLLDWLAAEFLEQGWSMKAMHRLIMTSTTYRLASTPDDQNQNAQIDPENVFLWRMNSRRLEAEVVRDNLLYVTGSLDSTRGGPDIDHKLGLSSKRRSLYLRLAAEKEVEFLKIFDGPSVTECYERRPSVVPQQALALANSELALKQARFLALTLRKAAGTDDKRFVAEAFRKILNREPGRAEAQLCAEFLVQPTERARENLVLVLLNHNDFVTVR